MFGRLFRSSVALPSLLVSGSLLSTALCVPSPRVNAFDALLPPAPVDNRTVSPDMFRPPTPAELETMKAQVKKSLADGGADGPFPWPRADYTRMLKGYLNRELNAEEVAWVEAQKAVEKHPAFAPLSAEDEARISELRKKLYAEIRAEQLQESLEKASRLRQPIEAALKPTEFQPFTLASSTDISPNTRLLRFYLPREFQTLGMSVASCLVTRAEIDGKAIIRPYTPVSSESTRGTFDLIVKTYPQGIMSKHLYSMAVGDSVEFKGPFVKLAYTANMKAAIGMVAGGSGITPMYQVIKKVLSDPRDKTEIRLIFANEKEEDILLKTELDALAVLYPNFKVYYTLSHPPQGWTGFTGHVNKSMCADVLPPPDANHLIMVCGPPGMMQAISGGKTKDNQQGDLAGLLKDMGFDASQVFKF